MVCNKFKIEIQMLGTASLAVTKTETNVNIDQHNFEIVCK
jgi:hypothetical protein